MKLPFIALAAFGLVMTPPALAQTPDGNGAALKPYGRLVEKARGAIAQGDYAQAKFILDDIVQEVPKVEVRFLAGVASLGSGDARTAERYFKSALRFAGADAHVGAESGLAIAYLRLNRRDEAQKVLSRLKTRQAKCSSRCSDPASLQQAITTVERALS